MKTNLYKIPLVIIGLLVSIVFSGWVFAVIGKHLGDLLESFDLWVLWDVEPLYDPETYLIGVAVASFAVVWWWLFIAPNTKRSRRFMAGDPDVVEGGLENSRFMNDKELEFNFPGYKYSALGRVQNDGIAVKAVYKRGWNDIEINIAPPMHGLIIGATGSGKTTTFISPVIQIIGATAAKSSMVCTDPKGELFQLHSSYLSEKGWRCMILDLREPYNSFRWNPLEDIYVRYQQYLHLGDEIYRRRDPVERSGLPLASKQQAFVEEDWYEYDGKAYATRKHLLNVVRNERQKIYDELYEDLSDLVSVLCPVESADDPVWEKGARSIIMAVALGMLEDSEFPELGMTKEKFCFYNLNKALGNSENNFLTLRNYFAGRSRLAKSVNMSKQVLSAAGETLASYMSITFDKMSIFNDEGICALTSGTDIDPMSFADQPTALFLKIPDEKDTRYVLAAVFVLSIYKALVKKASSREDLSLPRNVYFLLDEFGNMPKIDKFEKMITVGRSRKIWFQMVVQSYAQLGNVYGDKVSDIIKSNCGLKLFIGSNDIETCKEFSELCGNMTVSTNSVSSQVGEKAGQYNVSAQIQTRPLIYPSDLQKLNNKANSGNAILVSFGNYPLKTKYTPSYECPLYKFGEMPMGDLAVSEFYGEDIYYDLGERNTTVMKQMEDRAAGKNVEEPPPIPISAEAGDSREEPPLWSDDDDDDDYDD